MGRDDASCLTVNVEGAKASLTINRPEAHNALNAAVFDALDAALDRIDREGDVRIATIRGEGARAFCAGADVDDLRGLSSEEAMRLIGRGQGVFRKVEELRVPVIAAVQGWALGGGFELALACDLIVASQSARFGLPEAGLGLIPGYGGTQRLTRAVGRKAALSCMLLGEHYDADRAWQLGLLARPAVEDGRLEEQLEAVQGRLLSCGPQAIASIREVVRTADPIASGLAHETALAAIAIDSREAAEGVLAFLEKRPPDFARGTD